MVNFTECVYHDLQTGFIFRFPKSRKKCIVFIDCMKGFDLVNNRRVTIVPVAIENSMPSLSGLIDIGTFHNQQYRHSRVGKGPHRQSRFIRMLTPKSPRLTALSIRSAYESGLG